MPIAILIHLAVSATIDMGRKLGAVPFLRAGSWVHALKKVHSPHLAQYSLDPGLPPYQVAYLDASSRLATIDMGRKLGRGLCPLFVADLAQCGLGRGLPPWQVSS